MNEVNKMLLKKQCGIVSPSFEAIAKKSRRKTCIVDFDSYNTNEQSNEPTQCNPFYLGFKNTPPILVVHNLLNYGIGSKRELFSKAKNRFEKSRKIKLVKFECSNLNNESDCCNVIFKIVNSAYRLYNSVEFNKKCCQEVKLLLNSLHTDHIHQRPFIFMLNDIDTPFLSGHHNYFLCFLPQMISLLPTCRFILNTNTVDGPYLFSLAELLQMKMVLNSVVGIKWGNTVWFKEYVPTVIQAKKKAKATIRMDIFKKLSALQKNICITLIDCNNYSESALLDAFRSKFDNVTQSSFSQGLKKLKEIGVVSTTNGLVTLLIKKDKIEKALSLI